MEGQRQAMSVLFRNELEWGLSLWMRLYHYRVVVVVVVVAVFAWTAFFVEKALHLLLFHWRLMCLPLVVARTRKDRRLRLLLQVQ
jgi:hypothetical protein